MKEVVIESMDFKVLTADELMKIISNPNTGEWDIPITKVNEHSKFTGFNYFTPKNLLDISKNLKFLVCIVNRNQVAGVLMIADYDDYGKTYVGLNYIDVHEGFRRKGIAKGLYSLLNTSLPKDTLFISSPLSKMGKEANLDKLRKSIVKNFITYDNRGEYLLCATYEFYQTS